MGWENCSKNFKNHSSKISLILSMKRVLIITYHFPPVNNINSRRFGEMTPYMPNFGWEPIILTTKSEGSLAVKIPEENLIRIGENYYKEGVVAEEGEKGIPSILKLPYFFYKNLGIEIWSIDRFLFTWGREVKKNKEIIKDRKPDLIIATCYPHAPLWVGRFFSKEIKKPWIADLHDPLSLWNNSKFPFIKFLDEQIDKSLLKSASTIITLGSYLASRMEKLYQRPIEIIYNGFDKIKEEADKENGQMAQKKKTKIIYYAGRFHFHRMPAVKLFIDWLAKNKKDNLSFTLRSLGPLEADEEILKYAKEKNVISKINLLQPASPEIIFQEEKEADILILFEDLNKIMRNSEGTLPGKLMEYLQFKSPIVAINRSDSEIGEILRKTSRGYLASNIEELDKAMQDSLYGKFPVFDWEKVKAYSRFSQCEKLCEIFNRVAYESKR